MKFYRLFKIQPPLTLNRLNTAWNSSWSMRPSHLQRRCQFFGDLVSARPQCSFVSFPKRDYVGYGQQLAFGKSGCGIYQIAGDEFGTLARTHEMRFSQ